MILGFIGRVMFVSLFLLAGIQKLTEQEKQAQYMKEKYSKYISFHNNMISDLRQKINLHSAEYDQYLFWSRIPEIIMAIGFFEIITSILILMQLPYLSCLSALLLSVFSLFCAFICHNPFLSKSNNKLFHYELQQFVFNIIIAGCALAIAQTVQKKKKEFHQKEHLTKAQKQSRTNARRM